MEDGEDMTNRDKKGRLTKGSILNSNGRKIGSLSLVNMLKKELLKIPEGQKRTYAVLFIKRYLKSVIQDGNTKLMTDLINRIDGVPTTKMVLVGDEKEPLVIITNGSKTE
jgi:hypothetical protein